MTAKIFIIAARSNQAIPMKKMKCFFNQHKWEEAIRACTERELNFIAVQCRAEDGMLIPESWYSRGLKPYPTSELEKNLEEVAEWKWKQRFEFTETDKYVEAQLFGEL